MTHEDDSQRSPEETSLAQEIAKDKVALRVGAQEVGAVECG